MGRICTILSIACSTVPVLAEPPPPDFERDIVPILTAYCWKCHGGEGRLADLDLRTWPLIVQGGKTGPAIVPGSAAQSLLYRKLAEGEMPPKGELKPTDEHVALIRAWLDGGAPAHYTGTDDLDPDAPETTEANRAWWAFRTPARPGVPDVQSRNRVRTPIDAFALRKLEAKGLRYSADADRVTLIRRIYLDLIGLPPEPEAIDAFVADPSPEAYDVLVTSLLASPHYGERWGRHWLDAAGYVDTIGVDNDAAIIKDRPRISRYRDYVVRAFNADKPYDRFLLEQIAGDELVDWRSAPKFTPEIRERLIATGFLRQIGDVTNEPELNTADIRHQVLYDAVQILSSNLLGLTLHCARCHDHKFDPISQQDYFRLAALLLPAYNPQNWKHSDERFLPDVSSADKQRIDAHNAEVDAKITALKEQAATVRGPFRQRLLDAKLAAIPEPIRADTKVAVETPKKERNEVQKYLARKFGPQLAVPDEDIAKALDDAARAQCNELKGQIARLESTKQSYGLIHALWDVGPPPPAYIYRRGEYAAPGQRVEPGVLAVLDDREQPFRPPVSANGANTSGYRTAFARWLTRPDHPLTARVIVNRIWQQYFGRGIVATPDNFGTSGAKPTHPELLDWLATEFVNSGWRFKHLHRLIVSSTAYRQASRRDMHAGAADIIDPREIDPENRLLWRMPLRRLESEVIRDRMLAVSGQLDCAMGGPPAPLKPNPDGSVEVDMDKLPTPSSHLRRSLYLLARRNYHLTELNVFDQPLLAHNCTRRTASAVVMQSLTMLNGKFAHDQSEHFAARVRGRAGAGGAGCIETAFRLALGRSPKAEEVALAENLLRRQTRRHAMDENTGAEAAAHAALVNLCHMLLNSNEFLYVD